MIVFILANAFLGYAVYRKNPKKEENRIFALIALGAIVWIFTTMMADNVKIISEATWWVKLAIVGPMFIAPLFYRFSQIFPSDYKKSRDLTLAERLFIFIPGIIILLLAPTTLNIKSAIINQSNQLDAKPGQLYYFFLAYLIIFVVLAIRNFIISYKNLSTDARDSLKFLLIGLSLTVFFGIFFNVILLIFGINTLARFGSMTSFFFVAFTAYSILAHRLFDIKVILTETASIIVISALIFEAIIVKDPGTKALTITIAIIAIYGAYLLIKSVNQEIHQRKQVEILAGQLKVANEKLKQVDAMKTEFISLASHELLTPISAIEGYLSMMLDEKLVKIDDPKAIQYMQSVYKSAKRLARLVADLLNVSRIEQGRMLVEKKEIDLKSLIEEVVKELRFKVEKRHHKLLTNFRDNIDTKTYADEDKIKEVIINLAGNSIKYTNDGGLIGIGIDVWPTSKVQKHFDLMQSELKEHGKTSEGSLQNIVNEKLAELIGEKQIVIIVKDNGVGIAHGDVGKLFQKFSRVGDWSTQEVQGTGLGLYISRALVEMHHGRIWASSEGEGKGSTFYFSLPTLEAEEKIKQLDSQVPVSKDAKPLAKSAEKI